MRALTRELLLLPLAQQIRQERAVDDDEDGDSDRKDRQDHAHDTEERAHVPRVPVAGRGLTPLGGHRCSLRSAFTCDEAGEMIITIAEQSFERGHTLEVVADLIFLGHPDCAV